MPEPAVEERILSLLSNIQEEQRKANNRMDRLECSINTKSSAADTYAPQLSFIEKMLPQKWPEELLRDELRRKALISDIIEPVRRAFTNSKVKGDIYSDKAMLQEYEEWLDEGMRAHATNLAESANVVPPPELRRVVLKAQELMLKHREGPAVAARFREKLKMRDVDPECREALEDALELAKTMRLQQAIHAGNGAAPKSDTHGGNKKGSGNKSGESH